MEGTIDISMSTILVPPAEEIKRGWRRKANSAICVGIWLLQVVGPIIVTCPTIRGPMVLHVFDKCWVKEAHGWQRTNRVSTCKV